MSTEQTVLTTDDPTAVTNAPTASGTRAGTPGRARRWLVGATLVTVGLVAGSGATYAVTAPGNSGLPDAVAGYTAPAGNPRGGGPLGTPPQSGGSTTDGETT